MIKEIRVLNVTDLLTVWCNSILALPVIYFNILFCVSVYLENLLVKTTTK